MRILKDPKHFEYMEEATSLARLATCERAKCGSVIVKNGIIIGRGFNSPPGNLENQRRCSFSKKDYDPKITDKTCCIHAEQRAILDALRNGHDLEGSTLYFMRVNEDGEMTKAGDPYCTICSKMTLDTGIENFVLWHEEGLTAYPCTEYNDLSFEFSK